MAPAPSSGPADRLGEIDAAARKVSLRLLGGFHPVASDRVPVPCGTLLLLGPDEPGFWPVFRDSPEGQDGAPDPMDRWSSRVIGDLGGQLGATALFPFGVAPALPFYSWALRTGRVHASPVLFLVHDVAGLWVSFRGALAFPERITLPPAPPSPCLGCADKPCLSACPPRALTGEGYDVPACKSFLASDEGGICADGCRVRASCPVSAQWPRHPEQSVFHMRAFTG